MSSRRVVGEGTIYHRKDGRWEGSVFATTVSGKRKKVSVYGATRKIAREKLNEKIRDESRNIPVSDQSWTVGGYLDHWLQEVVAKKNRPRTLELYEAVVRNHLKPALGAIRLQNLTGRDVQSFLDEKFETTTTIRSIHLMRSVLRIALGKAERQELIHRNVAKLVELKPYQRKKVKPWSADEARQFLVAASSHAWHLAYVMVLLYGLRRGEVLGLRWTDVDFKRSRFEVTQQIQRIGSVLIASPVKTEAGERSLPLIEAIRRSVEALHINRFGHEPVDESASQIPIDSLVFLSATGTPIDPKNFARTFHEISDRSGLRRVTLHQASRHTSATLLKQLGVPDRDIQLILGHAHVTTTQQIYQHEDLEGQRRGLTRAGEVLLGSQKQAELPSESTVKVANSKGESTNFALLTSGGSTGARTRDTLLKRLIRDILASSPTPVLQHARTRAYATLVGHLAVKGLRQSTHTFDESEAVAQALLTLQSIRGAQLQILCERSFPFNLLPPSNGPPRTN
ncbi:tyrosine-type recombinase/integrase [Kribbella antibiotica]|nr:site-specific integrase [Kribbella antibiotica]